MASYTVLEQVKIRLKQYHMDTASNAVVFDKIEDNILLEQLIEQAKADVADVRRYPASYTKEDVENDLRRYESVIINLAVYDRVKLGGDFQQSDSENGKSRSWIDRDKLFSSVSPIANII